MGKDQLAGFRGRPGPRNPRATNTPTPTRLDDESPAPHPLSILALAASIRLDDPKQEHERVVMLEVAIVTGQEAAKALDGWISQSLAEYRGSRGASDLQATTAEFRLKLDQFDGVLRASADRLAALIPSLTDAMPGFIPVSPSKPSGRRDLDEVAAASDPLKAIGGRVANTTMPGRLPVA